GLEVSIGGAIGKPEGRADGCDHGCPLTIPVYPEVRDPRNPWACKEEIMLADAIAANISRAEKKKKCRIVCRTHGVGSVHHASDILYAPWESLLIPNVLGIALMTQSLRPLGLQPVYAADHV
nr:hypothetical protein [Tanacetum cinerariifolium]